MIRVYIYVTGLALYQFSTGANLPAKALLASGGFEYPGLSEIHRHEWTVMSADDVVSIPGDLLRVRFKNAGTSTTSSNEATQQIPNLADLTRRADGTSSSVRAECADSTRLGECKAPFSSETATNGLVEFDGKWEINAYIDCGKRYPTASTTSARLNFVPAGRAWKPLYGDLDKAPAIFNSVLFSTLIASPAELQISEKYLSDKIVVDDETNCAGLPDFGTDNDDRCIRILIRNGTDAPYVGGADSHYAAIYSLMTSPPLAHEMLLPVSGRGMACDDEGGGSGGLSHCIGGYVVK